MKHLGAVGENVLHLCFLNASRVHYELAKRIISKYPAMVNDIYLSDEYYGKSGNNLICLEFQALKHSLVKWHRKLSGYYGNNYRLIELVRV